jgi:hypothetical protein
MYTRKDYIANKVSHEEYYGQFVDAFVKDKVLRFIGKERIMASIDPHFNDIPLHKWDAVFCVCPSDIIAKLELHGDSVSMAGLVCIAKEGARQIKGETLFHENS